MMLFIERKGYNIDKNILSKENKSSILMEVNGKSSACNRILALNIHHYFFDRSS